MHWNKITIRASPGMLEELEGLLWDLSAVSVTVTDSEDNPIYEPGPGETPLWSKLDVCGLFEQDVDRDELAQRIEGMGYQVLSSEELGDRHWEREWLSRFKPMQFGRRLWICPSDQTVPDVNSVVVKLDPGLAFGTGTHATTRLCLEWLDMNALQGIRVVDFGSGSGVLGIAALLLGAKSVLAVDNDPQALRATTDNSERNKVGQYLATRLADEQERIEKIAPDSPYDLVIANILAQPLVDLSSRLVTMLKPGGYLLLSGIMESQRSWVEAAYQGIVEFDSCTRGDGWVCLHAKKNE